MARYSEFLTGDNEFIGEKYKVKFKIYRNSPTDKYYTAHVYKPKVKKGGKRTELDELYYESKKECGRMYDVSLDEKMKKIRFVLEQNLNTRRKYDKSDEYEKMKAGLDNYISERKELERFNSEQREKRFNRKFAFNRSIFNYVFTLTWSPERYKTPEEWIDGVLRYFGNVCFRKGVKIIGAFEFGDENGRVHFHGVGYFPEDFFGNGLNYVKRYSTKRKRWEKVLEYDYLAKRFGINDFDPLKIKSKAELSSVLGYITKYVIKNNGRTYYSRGLEDGVHQYIDPKYCFYQFESNGMIKYKLAESFSFEKERFFRKVKELKEENLPFDNPE